MTIDLIFLVYNRLGYTKLALESILADPTEEFSLTIWDNGSTDGTWEYLESVEDPRIVRKVFCQENVRLHGAFNDMCEKSSADLVGIVPNDFIVPAGWTRPLAQAHADVEMFGMIGSWHLGEEFFDEERARHKIQTFGSHQVLRHPWTGGGAGLVKLDTIRKYGPLESSSTPLYWKKIARYGYINGFYYPLIHVEHMDYPWAEHHEIPGRDSEDFEVGVSYELNGIKTMDQALARHKFIVGEILDGHWDIKYYSGWRKRVKQIRKMLHI
jgi:glycosyltransferase involved in cell wall biosynthesis